MDLRHLLAPLGAACRRAGDRILEVRRAGFAVERKSDDSPVTEADQAAEAILLEALSRHAPGIPVIAEEEVAAGRIGQVGELYFLVDPLDGTREFVRGGPDFTVNIGLVRGGRPVLGLVLAPESGLLWSGLEGEGAWRSDGHGEPVPVRVRKRGDTLRCLMSRSHLNQATRDYIAAAAPAATLEAVGSSLKFCLLADGSADFYPRLSPTSEWDTAAGHAVLLAAGGRVDGPDGRPLAYGKADFVNPGFVATTGWEAPALADYLPA